MISGEHQEKINQLENNHDFPVFVNYDSIEHIINKIKGRYWQNQLSGKRCTFCSEHAMYWNYHLEMRACISCLIEIKNGKMDILDPRNHSLSKKLRSMFCDWVNREYYNLVEDIIYFHEYKITYNQCHLCHQTIECSADNQWIGIAIVTRSCQGTFVAHHSCAQKDGFRNVFTDQDYNNIFTGHRALTEQLEESLQED